MSFELDPKEVLMCLNELGYYNISSKQLKEFLKDLKTLIKHDNKKLTKENQENICPYPNRNSFYTTDNTSAINNNNNINNNGRNINEVKQNSKINAEELFDHLYKSSTTSSRAKSVSKPNSIISVAIRNTKKQPDVTRYAKNTNENTNSSSYTTIDTRSDKLSATDFNCKSKTDIESIATCSKVSCCIRNETTRKTTSCCCLRNEPVKKTSTITMLKPKVSFIKPRRPVKTCKSDPVSLYQHYQKEWKKQKLPGEDKRYDLRWAIRERMIGEPEIRVHPLDKARKSNKSNKF